MVTAKERNKVAQKEIDLKMRYQRRRDIYCDSAKRILSWLTTGVEVFPQGWDKTYCLRYRDEFREIHFFGDKTYKGGNDFEIYESERTLGHTVTSPEDTMKQCTELFLTEQV